MIKIAYQNSSIECSTIEEAERVLRILNEFRRERAAEGGGCRTVIRLHGSKPGISSPKRRTDSDRKPN
ncbi:MAG: hypothetical protein ACRDQZ_25475 [Mycobacteriales bacterium]